MREISKSETEGIVKMDWVIITITGNPALAKEIKETLALFLDWLILHPQHFLRTRPFLKDYDHTTALTNTDRLIFGLARVLNRNRGEKAGFVSIEEAPSEDKEGL